VAPLKTFSISFDDPEFDESGYQNEAVRFLGRITGGPLHPRRHRPRLPGRGLAHGAAHPANGSGALYVLSGLVRRHGYKVVLTGEGSDEMLGGYDIFRKPRSGASARPVPTPGGGRCC